MKAKSIRESARAHEPYKDTKGKRTSKSRKPTLSKPKPLPNVPSSSLATSAPAGHGTVLFRKLCMDNIRKNYPEIEPRSDFEILTLASKRLKGTLAEIYAELDVELAMDAPEFGVEFILESATQILDTYVEPTGWKPKTLDKDLIDTKCVFIRPITDTKYSLRLFPGSYTAAEYCMDFVETATGKPMNSPFEFELWGVPNPDTPWLTFPICGKVRSLERAFGVKQEDIVPGAEKFVLRDGQTCVLARPGKRSIRFTVPVRKIAAPAVVEDVEVLDLPRYVDV
ncbi:hypothetical protein C2E23DRAFT_821366 [Lenzites betulinus]|nr:hypothetical protein C2E23DRAFT_821366 [Lenzites betulinus]